MVEHSPINFPEKIERHDSSRDVVLFAARTRDGEVNCAISGEALEDHYGPTCEHHGTGNPERVLRRQAMRGRGDETHRP